MVKKWYADDADASNADLYGFCISENQRYLYQRHQRSKINIENETTHLVSYYCLGTGLFC
jgi:hypothetical protein